jgi:phosphatidylserine decarboxylase
MSAKVLLQYALPHRFLSRVVYWATRWTWKPWKNFLISTIVKSYNVDMSQAQEPDASTYPHFNAFFTRALKPGARSEPADPKAVLSPADGRISQAGKIRDGRIFQAKGQDYSTVELLGDDIAAAPYRDGWFATIYLSPRDYHRVHMPLAGRLIETLHIPGRLFSVAPFTVDEVPRLFARNERLVCHFEGDFGPFAVVLVGAMLVSSVATVWGGLEIPPYALKIERTDYRGRGVSLARFAEMGRFNMGSTVIVLLPKVAGELDSELANGVAMQVGQPIGRLL